MKPNLYVVHRGSLNSSSTADGYYTDVANGISQARADGINDVIIDPKKYGINTGSNHTISVTAGAERHSSSVDLNVTITVDGVEIYNNKSSGDKDHEDGSSASAGAAFSFDTSTYD